MTKQNEKVGHAALVSGEQTVLHGHPGGGGVNVKSGTMSASTGSNSVTFNTAFASVPQVVLTVQDIIALRDCLYEVTVVDVNGFTFVVDVAATYVWVATDAGNP